MTTMIYEAPKKSIRAGWLENRLRKQGFESVEVNAIRNSDDVPTGFIETGWYALVGRRGTLTDRGVIGTERTWVFLGKNIKQARNRIDHMAPNGTPQHGFIDNEELIS